MKMRLMVVLPFLALNGCSETDMLPYQGRPAATALECNAAYDAAKSRMSSSTADYSSGASIIGTAIGLGMVHGMIDSDYKTCLARVAGIVPGPSVALPATDAAIPGPSTPASGSVPAPQYSAAPGCRPGGGAMQGGTSYCIAK